MGWTASRRPPEALAPQARAIGPTVVAKSLRDALEADTIILAVPFGEHREVAKALPSWKGKTVIDAMTAYLRDSNSNLGGAFRTSRESDEVMERGRAAAADFTPPPSGFAAPPCGLAAGSAAPTAAT